jgi:hypothetical protein
VGAAAVTAQRHGGLRPMGAAAVGAAACMGQYEQQALLVC